LNMATYVPNCMMSHPRISRSWSQVPHYALNNILDFTLTQSVPLTVSHRFK